MTVAQSKSRQFLLFLPIPILIFAIVLIAGSKPAAVGATITAPQKLVNFTKSYMTTFLGDSQLWQETYTVGYGFFALQSQSAIGNNMTSTFTTSLIGTAGLAAMQKLQCLYLRMGGPVGFQLALNQIIAVINTVSKPVYNQIYNEVVKMKSQLRGPNAQYSQIYRMCAQFWQQNNICVAMKGAHRNVSTIYWNAFKACLSDVVRFQNCGL